MMLTIGYIFGNKELTYEDKLFLRLTRKTGARVVTFPSMRHISPRQIVNKSARCDVIFNGSADLIAVEIAKIAEYAGALVLDPTQSFYYCEDKMLFSVICAKHDIPTPKTYLLPMPIHKCREPIRRLIRAHGAVVIKNIMADNGEFVGRAKTVVQALELIKRFRKRDLAPLIAQEYIHASRNVYRVMVLDGKVVQGVVKKSRHWKCTGEFVRGDAPVFHVPPPLEEMCVKIAQVTNLPLCGIDLMRKNDTWVAIEANSCPGMDFVKQDMARLYERLIAYLIRRANARKEAVRSAYADAIEKELPLIALTRTSGTKS